MSYGAYKSVVAANATSDTRDLEYRLLAQVTGQLIDAQDGKLTLQERLAAILKNEKVWSVFLSDLNEPSNGLPKALKVNLAGLALFVIKETNHVVDTDAPLDDLIMINRQIMAGLKPQSLSMAG
ncbi:MAG: flagellar biosynthesis regulator FlaF [Alphaproteobacteria bacterium]|nr:flagellar biosynthesis regulator FlaF [Alphaproteobacteria bacterium]